MANSKNYPEFKPSEIEQKWQQKWESDHLFSPDVKNAKNPYFNLMMFPYPSAEGLHVGNMYAFTGADVYARFQRMQGKDVFEPIGLDGFGIHSENYALKVGRHPKEQAALSEKNFYRQLRSIGNSFDWQRTVETYNPGYYRWTQWLFIQMFKNGLAYRDTALVNWCPKDLTVLSDEQVIDGKCERCGSEVEKRDLEQWFFRITKYAGRLLDNIDGLNWTEKVKIAQRNWIGKSEGAEVEFEVEVPSKYVFIHGHNGSMDKDFFPWLKAELEKRGSSVEGLELPTNGKPNIDVQVQFLLDKHVYDQNTIIVAHSLGCDVALKLVPQLKTAIRKLLLVAPPLKPVFQDGIKRPELEAACDWQFDFESVKTKVGEVIVIKDLQDDVIMADQPEEVSRLLDARLVETTANTPHFNTNGAEPTILQASVETLRIFTTRPDTLFGATFMVIAPEHQLAEEIANGIIPNTHHQEVKDYIETVKSKSEIERTGEGKQKTGVITGLMAVNPVNGEEIPVLVCDYVLGGYGTGAIMAVPAHDQRDYETAKAFNLPIRPVIKGKTDQNTDATVEGVYEGAGIITGSKDWDGWSVPADIPKVIDWLEEKGVGQRKANYHLRDWLISRQRYWGPPIPMIFCTNCQKNGEFEVEGMNGWFTVPENALPVLLPDVKDWKPMGTGKSPLANHPEFYNTKCPHCGGEATRETDVSDTFLDSAWYFLRYPSTDIDVEPFDIETTRKWLPVNQYIGGAEHSVLHLLYSRFVTMVLHDLHLVDFEEPFTNFFAHGLIIKDGAKMSKSKGNVVVPDEYIGKYGADTLRAYLMFIGPYSDGGDFRDSGIEGMYKFLRKVWKLLADRGPVVSSPPSDNPRFTAGALLGPPSASHPDEEVILQERLRIMHKTIQKVTKDIESFSFNTAIAALMEWYNTLSKFETVSSEEKKTYLQLLAPFAPHMTEELWMGVGEGSVHVSSWPQFNEKYLQSEKVLIVVQVNGKKRGEFELESLEIKNQAEAEKRAKETVSKHLQNVEVKKVIYVPGKIVNIVV